MALFKMDKAAGVTAAADHAAATAQPSQGTIPAPTCTAENQIVALEFKETLAALAANDIHVAFCLPAGHVFVDGYLISDDLDTANSVTLTVAQLLQDFTDIVAAAATDLLTASTIGQAGGRVDFNVANGLRLAAVAYDRWFGIKVVAGGALNGAPVLSGVVQYRASNGD